MLFRKIISIVTELKVRNNVRNKETRNKSVVFFSNERKAALVLWAKIAYVAYYIKYVLANEFSVCDFGSLLFDIVCNVSETWDMYSHKKWWHLVCI